MSCVQSTLATARHASQYPIRGLGPDKRLGVFIGNVQASVDGRFRFSAAIPTPSFQDDHCLVYRQNGPDWPFRHAGARGLIDTRRGSHRGHYVNPHPQGYTFTLSPTALAVVDVPSAAVTRPVQHSDDVVR